MTRIQRYMCDQRCRPIKADSGAICMAADVAMLEDELASARAQVARLSVDMVRHAQLEDFLAEVRALLPRPRMKRRKGLPQRFTRRMDAIRDAAARIENSCVGPDHPCVGPM